MAAIAPQAAELIAAARASGRPNAHLLPVAEARRCFEADMAAFGPGPQVWAVADAALPSGVPVRLYRPRAGRLGAVVYLHGGGWVIGSIASHDAVCRALALASGCVVVSVGYRRAPADPFPAAIDDAVAATRWVAAEAAALDVDPQRLALAGDSAGGNLALAVALLARDGGAPVPRVVVLAYPIATTDLEAGVDRAYDGLVLERDELAWHQDCYLPRRADRASPLASPLDRAELAGLPPTVVITAGCDPVRPQGERLAAALAAAGVAVGHHGYPGQIHGFFALPHVLDDGADAVRRAGDAIRARCAAAAPARGA